MNEPVAIETLLADIRARPNDVELQQALANHKAREWRFAIPGLHLWDPAPSGVVYPHLESLFIWQATGVPRFLAGLRAPLLKELNLSSLREWDAVVACVIDGRGLGFEKLTLGGPLSPARVTELCKAELPTIRSLALHAMILEPAASSALAAWPNLRHLRLDGCGLPAGFLEALTRSPQLESLEIVRGDMRKLAGQLRALEGFRGVLALEQCGLTNDHVAALASSPVTELGLRNNQKVDAGCLPVLMKLPSLRKVLLRGTMILRADAQRLVDHGVEVPDLSSLDRADGGVLHLKEVAASIVLGGWKPVLDLVRAGTITPTTLLAVEGESPTHLLHILARHGATAAIKSVLKSTPGGVEQTDPEGRRPLMLAASGRKAASGEQGHAAVVKLLLAEGADVAAVDPKGRAALHHAATVGAVACVKLLIKAGAKEHADTAGAKAMDLCASLAPEWIRAECQKVLKGAAT